MSKQRVEAGSSVNAVFKQRVEAGSSVNVVFKWRVEARFSVNLLLKQSEVPSENPPVTHLLQLAEISELQGCCRCRDVKHSVKSLLVRGPDLTVSRGMMKVAVAVPLSGSLMWWLMNSVRGTSGSPMWWLC